MRHRVKGRHLGRTAEHRRALARNLVTALLEHGRIRTTDAKAREVRPLAERLITLGKRGDLHARRQAARFVLSGPALSRLFGPLAERFATRPGGYTRLVKAGRRLGDAAPLAYLELLEEPARGAASGSDGAESPKAKRGPAEKGRGAAKPAPEKPPRGEAAAGKDRSREKARPAKSGRGAGAEASEEKKSGSGRKRGASSKSKRKR